MSRKAAHARRQTSIDIPKYPPQSVAAATMQNLPPPIVSDYESDNPGYISDYIPKVPPQKRTVEELNISVVRRYNPDIVAILSQAPYGVVYEFSPIPTPKWEKTGVEGTMFVNQLTAGLYGEDRYGVLVLNRRGLENFDAQLREAEDGGVEISDPYVIISYKEGHEQKIYGIFIFSEGTGTSTETTREDNAKLMKAVAEAGGASRRAAEAAAANAVEQHTKGHIQEAEAIVPSVNRTVNLEQFFGAQRKEDAGYSTQTHTDDRQHQQHNRDISASSEPGQAGPYPNHVLGDLFRRSGLT